MRPTFDRHLWILLYVYLLIKCIQPSSQQNIDLIYTESQSLRLADVSGVEFTETIFKVNDNEDREHASSSTSFTQETLHPAQTLSSTKPREKFQKTEYSHNSQLHFNNQETPNYQHVPGKQQSFAENINVHQQTLFSGNSKDIADKPYQKDIAAEQPEKHSDKKPTWNGVDVANVLHIADSSLKRTQTQLDESDNTGDVPEIQPPTLDSDVDFTTSIDPPFSSDTTTSSNLVDKDDIPTITVISKVSDSRRQPNDDDDEDDDDYSQKLQNDVNIEVKPPRQQDLEEQSSLEQNVRQGCETFKLLDAKEDNRDINKSTKEHENNFMPTNIHKHLNENNLDTPNNKTNSTSDRELESVSYSRYENDDNTHPKDMDSIKSSIIKRYDNKIIIKQHVDNTKEQVVERVRRSSSSSSHINNNNNINISYIENNNDNYDNNKFDEPKSFSYKSITKSILSTAVLNDDYNNNNNSENDNYNNNMNINRNNNPNNNNQINNHNNNINNNNKDNLHVVMNRRESGSGVFSSSDISQSDIRYNKTLLTDSNPSLSSSSSSSDLDASDYKLNTLPFESDSSPLSSPASSSLGNISPLSETDVSNFSNIIDKNLLSDAKLTSNEQMIIMDDDDVDDDEEFDSSIAASSRRRRTNRDGINDRNQRLPQSSSSSSLSSGAETYNSGSVDNGGIGDTSNMDDYSPEEPRALPLRPIIRGPSDSEQDEEMSVVYAEQHTEIKLICEVDMDIASSVWYKNGQIVHTMDRSTRPLDYRFIRDSPSALIITNVMLEDDGKWQCEAENFKGYIESARPVKLVVLDRPKAPYLLIDSRRLDAGNIFVPVKENSELSLACISEGGNPKPTLTWEVLLSPGVDRHAQKVAAEVLELEEIKNEKDKEPYKINSGAKSEARLPAVYRAHHNARILCVMEHPTLKMRQNASLLLDVQYTPSFAISRIPGFGYPLREGIEVSLKCDVDSNPPSTPVWQKDDGETPVVQTGDGYLNFTSLRREHSGWYKCTSRHLNFQYSSIGYYLSVRYDSVDVTSEPDDQEVSVAASHNPYKGQLEVQLGGAVTLQCPQGSLGCWSHLDPVTARLRGLGAGQSTPTGQFSLKNVVYQEAGTYKCIGHSVSNNKKKLEVLQTVQLQVKGPPTVVARNATPRAYPGSPLHLSVEFCANPPAYAARWLHGDRVYTPGNQYGIDVLAYAVVDLPTPFCKEARLTYVHMHDRVPRTFYFIVSSPGGVAEALFKVNFTLRHRALSNSVDEDEEELSEPEEIHFPVFGTSSTPGYIHRNFSSILLQQLLLLCIICIPLNVLL